MRLLDGKVVEGELERMSRYMVVLRLGGTRVLLFKHGLSLISVE